MSYRSTLFLITGVFVVFVTVVVVVYVEMSSVAFEIDTEMSLLLEPPLSGVNDRASVIKDLLSRYEHHLQRLNLALGKSDVLKNLFVRKLDENARGTLSGLRSLLAAGDYGEALRYVLTRIQEMSGEYSAVHEKLTLGFLLTIPILLAVYLASIYYLNLRFKKQFSKLALGIKALENHEYGYLVSVSKGDFAEIKMLAEGFNMLSTAIGNADNILFGILKEIPKDEDESD